MQQLLFRSAYLSHIISAIKIIRQLLAKLQLNYTVPYGLPLSVRDQPYFYNCPDDLRKLDNNVS